MLPSFVAFLRKFFDMIAKKTRNQQKAHFHSFSHFGSCLFIFFPGRVVREHQSFYCHSACMDDFSSSADTQLSTYNIFLFAKHANISPFFACEFALMWRSRLRCCFPPLIEENCSNDPDAFPRKYLFRGLFSWNCNQLNPEGFPETWFSSLVSTDAEERLLLLIYVCQLPTIDQLWRLEDGWSLKSGEKQFRVGPDCAIYAKW